MSMVERYYSKDTGVSGTKGGLSWLHGRVTSDDAAAWGTLRAEHAGKTKAQTDDYMDRVVAKFKSKDEAKSKKRPTSQSAFLNAAGGVFSFMSVSAIVLAATLAVSEDARDYAQSKIDGLTQGQSTDRPTRP